MTLTVLLGYVLRKRVNMPGICLVFAFITVIISFFIMSTNATVDMTNVVITSCERYELSTNAPVHIASNDSICYVVYTEANGTISKVNSTYVKLIYDNSETPYMLKMKYKYPDLRGFLFLGYGYTYYEFHLSS